MLVFRYLFKEVFYTLLALTVILLLVFLSNQMIQYMNRAASGQIPVMFLLKLLVIEMPNLLSLLLPLGFYIALIVAYGRLYAESEMTVLHACGYGYWTLLRHSFLMAAGVAALVLAIMVYLSPSIATQRVTLLRTSGVQFFLKTVAPERFNSTFPGHVFYIDSIDKKNQQAQHVFVAKKSPTGWDVIWANKAGIKTLASGEAILELKQGAFYRGQAGLANYQTATFADYQATLPKAEIDVSSDVRTLSTAKLLPWNNSDLKKAAELQWRLSIPLMVLTLTVMAIPLSRVNPRQGKYAKLLPAILLFMLYANFMFVARSWVEQGKVSTWIGVWWLHLAMVLLAVLLILYQKRKPV
jgi:lipopolysaccharide export system permease protein